MQVLRMKHELNERSLGMFLSPPGLSSDPSSPIFIDGSAAAAYSRGICAVPREQSLDDTDFGDTSKIFYVSCLWRLHKVLSSEVVLGPSAGEM